MAEVGCLKDGNFQNLQVNSKPIYNSGLFTRVEKIIDDGDHLRTLTEAETNTVFIIDDAALAITLPNVSSTSLGVTYKFILAEEEPTGDAFVIKTQGDTHWLRGYSVSSMGTAVSSSALPNNGGGGATAFSKITLNGSTTGGNLIGESGNTLPHTTIVITCIGTGPGPCWFAEVITCNTTGDTPATPFTAA